MFLLLRLFQVCTDLNFKLFFVPNLPDPNFGFMQNLQQPTSAESQLQSLPPAVQKAIFLHLAQQQQQHHQQQESHSQENEPQSAECQDDNFTRGGVFFFNAFIFLILCLVR